MTAFCFELEGLLAHSDSILCINSISLATQAYDRNNRRQLHFYLAHTSHSCKISTL